MSKMRLFHLLFAALFSFLIAANGQYTQSLVRDYAPGYNNPDNEGENDVNRSASAEPNDLGTMSEIFETAFDNNRGGTFDFPTTTSSNHQTEFRGAFGDGKEIRFTSTQLIQSVGWPSGSFFPISGRFGKTQNSDSSGFTFNFSVTDTAGNPLPDEYIESVGIVVLSRNATGGYPLDVRVTAFFDNDTNTSETVTIGTPRGTDDVFFGFTAPSGVGISSLQFESFAEGTTTPVNTRIAFDDLGFAVIPEPAHAGILLGAIAIAGLFVCRARHAKRG